MDGVQGARREQGALPLFKSLFLWVKYWFLAKSVLLKTWSRRGSLAQKVK